jgi:hypothetical protein
VLALAGGCENKRAPSSAATDGAAAAERAADESAVSVAAPAPPSPALAVTSDDGADAGRAPPPWPFDCADTSTPKAGKSIGHTSVVFKLELSSGKKAAWKPNAKKVKGRYRGEVAAFRLAEALGIANVPPACVRAFDAGAAAAALAANREASKLFADEVIVEQGKVHGVIIPWIDGLSFWPIEKEPLRSEARAWLTAGTEIPAARFDLARQASSLVAFDFVTGNWDRFSGENVGIDRTGALVLYIDNDAAFMERPPKESMARSKARLDATDRFSRSFIAAMRRLDEERLAAVFGEEAPGRALLPKAMVSTVARRIEDLVAAVDAKVAAHGETETLYFP